MKDVQKLFAEVNFIEIILENNMDAKNIPQVEKMK